MTAAKLSALPSADWATPATKWEEIVERYVTYIQVPAWRVNAFTKRGDETRPCVPRNEAMRLSARLMEVVDRLLVRKPGGRPASFADLRRLSRHCGRDISREKRCSQEMFDRLSRAFLLNESRYTCIYCQRTAWGVYGEAYPDERPRTLRFELDHRTPRRKMAKIDEISPGDLVIACRSCNTLKGEMTEARFLSELRSLAAAVQRLPSSQ